MGYISYGYIYIYQPWDISYKTSLKGTTAGTDWRRRKATMADSELGCRHGRYTVGGNLPRVRGYPRVNTYPQGENIPRVNVRNYRG